MFEFLNIFCNFLKISLTQKKTFMGIKMVKAVYLCGNSENVEKCDFMIKKAVKILMFILFCMSNYYDLLICFNSNEEILSAEFFVLH